MWYVIVIIVNRYILLHQDISHISSSTDLTNIDQRQHWVQTLRNHSLIKALHVDWIIRNHSLIKALHVDWIIVPSRLYMLTWKWIWRISLPNQSMVQHFELSEICFFTIVLMYATKGGSQFWSLVSKYISSWSIHSRHLTVNRWILHYQSSRDIPYHGGASNPSCSWRRFQYQSTQGWSPYGGDFNFTYSWKHIAHCKKWTWTWPNLMVSVDLTRYHMWSWMYVRCSITGDIQEMSWLSCLLQISSEIPYGLTRTLFISYMSRFQELSFADQLRDIKLCARYLSGMDGLQCLLKYTHEVRGGERE